MRLKDPKKLTFRKNAGAWLAKKRKAARLSQRDLQNSLGIKSKSVVSQMELGKMAVPVDQYAAYASALGLSLGRFSRGYFKRREPEIFACLYFTETPSTSADQQAHRNDDPDFPEPSFSADLD